MAVYGLDGRQVDRIRRAIETVEGGFGNPLGNRPGGQSAQLKLGRADAPAAAGLSALFKWYRSTAVGTSEILAPGSTFVPAYDWFDQGITTDKKYLLFRPIPSPRWYAIPQDVAAIRGFLRANIFQPAGFLNSGTTYRHFLIDPPIFSTNTTQTGIGGDGVYKLNKTGIWRFSYSLDILFATSGFATTGVMVFGHRFATGGGTAWTEIDPGSVNIYWPSTLVGGPGQTKRLHCVNTGVFQVFDATTEYAFQHAFIFSSATDEGIQPAGGSFHFDYLGSA